MSRVLYFDCFAGAAGDMVLGALIDAGLPLDGLRAALGSLALEDGIAVEADRVSRAGVSAIKFRVHEHPSHPPHESHPPHPSHHHHDHRSLKAIEQAIHRSALSPAGRERAVALFRRLGEAEAAIHQVPLERVHLHEVGALDSIVDIVGAVFAFEWFGVDEIVVSPLNVGGGTVVCAHGTFPVPAPATARLLAGAPTYSTGVQAELVTPTGALLMTGYASAFGPMPPMRVERIGYGAGDRDVPGFPNVLRVFVGDRLEQRVESQGAVGLPPSLEASADRRPPTRDASADRRSLGEGGSLGGGGQADRRNETLETIIVLECEIDDMSPQIFGALMDRLHGAGALDVFYAPVQMKKNRPGTLITVLAAPERREALADLLFRESTTIGVRWHEATRERLDREVVTVATPLGDVRVKVARRRGQVVNVSPEFDDCVRIAETHGVPIKEVHAAAMRAYAGSR